MAYVDNVRMFARVYELGSMSAAARDQRVSAAVASARVGALEAHLGVRLFQRTTRSLTATEQGRLFYEGAKRILEAIEDAESAVTDVTQNPRGSLYVSAPFSVGRRFIAPQVPAFRAQYPEINVRMRLSDRKVDVTAEALDLAFVLGQPEDSTLKMRVIADCRRVLAASPTYVARRGMPADGDALVAERHDCLLLRFPGAPEFQWTLETTDGPRRMAVDGPFASDDGEVLTGWALAGEGIVLKPVFEIAEHLASGRLVPVAAATPPQPARLAVLYTHRRYQDPKSRLFIAFMAERLSEDVRRAEAAAQLPR
ncbi:LysR family transcriptional regulator [Halovulum dunhuangense]|uniref:LysR family transcriptional regulator n=1 Tax=Halovulum dunhuangense TaxID=1505036 RepID=A0A849KVP2_9RHOB|nr:LysR family transcriptional regulator [Halovulum dunhuangense]NNU79488.1 LysR family transcriptional regulator [Halovulum dunhuangense]